MAVRNSVEIGKAIMKIAKKLTDSQRLLRLLRYTDEDPFSEQHEDVSLKDVIHENIRVIPLVNETEDNTESTVVIIPAKGSVDAENSEFKELALSVLVYVPIKKWLLNDINLRPFLIMSEIEKKLKGSRVEGLGTIKYWGFDLQLVTDIISCYRMEFSIDLFN